MTIKWNFRRKKNCGCSRHLDVSQGVGFEESGFTPLEEPAIFFLCQLLLGFGYCLMVSWLICRLSFTPSVEIKVLCEQTRELDR